MAGPTLIQIKRSLNTATPGSLANGEFAYSSNGDALFIGANSVVVPVGGKRVPGVLTANQAIVTNSTNMIDILKLGNTSVNVVVNASSLTISDSTNTVTIIRPTTVEKGGNYYLKADGSWSTVTGATADPAGGNTNIQYNDSGTMNGSDAFTYNETTNNVFVANTLIAGNGLDWGGATANIVANSTYIRLANSTVTFDITKPTAAQVTATNYYLASDSTWKQVTTSADLDDLTDVTITSPANNQFIVYDADATQWENHAAGNGFTFAGQSPAVFGGDGIVVNATGVHVKANNGITVTADGVFVDGANGVTIDAGGVNVRAGTDGGLTVNSTGVWVFANNGLLANATGLHVGTGNGMAVDADAIRVVANSGLVSNSTGVHVIANNGIVANSTGVFANIGSTLAFTTGAIGVNTNLSIVDLTLSGNLSVSGTLVTVDTTNMAVNDSIISLARNNGADTLDIGFYGQYNDGSDRFTGLLWDTSGDVFELFSNTTVEPTTTVDTGGAGYVRATLQSYLKSGWGTGTLVANSTGVTITGNSTYAVAITGNTLSLSTPLVVGSGGIGIGTVALGAILVGNAAANLVPLTAAAAGYILQSNGTSVVYDTLDGGTF